MTNASTTTQKLAKRGVRQTRKTLRRFGSLTFDTLKSLVGVGQRRINRRSNRTISGRFLNDIITLAETTHLTGLKVNLSDVLIEPRFLPPPPIIEPIAEDDVRQEVFYVVPRHPDYPYLYAPYNLPSFRIEQLAQGHRRLAILGLPGSGRTTALMAIALWAVKEVVFLEKDDDVKKRIEAEIAKLSDKERKEREEKRAQQLKEARENLEATLQERGKQEKRVTNAAEAFEAEAKKDDLPPFERLLPLYIHLSDVNINPDAFGNEIDPAEPLVRALQRRVSTLTARTIPRLIYQRLEENRTLLLIDGYSDLPPSEQKAAYAWLAALMEQYGDNFFIMTGPATGYGPLTQLDITPLFLKPWTEQNISEYVEKWAAQWPFITGTKRKPGPEITKAQQKRAAKDCHALSPAEITLKILAAFTEEHPPTYIDEWIESFIRHQLPDGTTYADILPLMQAAAAQQTELGYFTRAGIEVLVKQQETTGTAAANQQSMTILDVDGDGTADEDTSADTDDEDEFEDADDEATVRSRQMRTLIFCGLIVPYRAGRYRYRHSVLSHYMASLTLTDLPENDPQTLYDIALKPTWKHPLAFAAAHTTLDNVVQYRLGAPENILHSNLMDMISWLRYLKDPPPAWRDDLINRLGDAFVNEGQFMVIRERIAGALVSSRDVSSAARVFEFGLKQPDFDVRSLSCLGLGAIGQHGHRYTENLIDLVERANEIEEVQLAAIHALGAIGSETAKNAMTDIFLNSEERQRQAVAEAFAAMPKDGYTNLYDAISLTDNEVAGSMFVRRAALFGLQRIETDWARELIRDRFIAENEDYVRLKLEAVFMEIFESQQTPEPQRGLEDIEWIREWANEYGLPLRGKRARASLSRALEEPDAETQALGAVSLGQFGIVEAVKPLYAKLTNPDLVVRDAAYRALVELEIKMGKRLENPL